MRPVFQATRYPDYGPVYPFAYSADRTGAPREGATVRFAWDASGLYVSAEMEDSCLIQQNRANEQLHYQTGDVLELFVKPLNDLYYWEMYATPFGSKSTLFFPGEPSELTLEQALNEHGFQGLEVSSDKISIRLRGEASARQEGWETRMFVPASQLTALGAGWGDGTEWTVFCGRYNYNSDNLADPELSMAPALSVTHYHLIDEYARLSLVEEETGVNRSFLG